MDICIKKKEKIDQIALENCLPTIFNHLEQQKKYLKRFFKEEGLPAFCYRDDYQSEIKGYWDCFYYFIIGASVRFKENNEIEIGKIKSCDIKEKKVIIETENRSLEKEFSKVTRIFPSNFYQDLFK